MREVRQLTDSFGAASGLLVVDVQSVVQRHDCFFKLQPTSQFPVTTNHKTVQDKTQVVPFFLSFFLFFLLIHKTTNICQLCNNYKH